MNTEEHDDLWRVLGKAKAHEVSPFFARNILRQIRANEQAHRSIFSRISRTWRMTAVSAAVLVLLAVSIAPTLIFSPASRRTASATQQGVVDYEVINHLDELLAYDDDSLWLDNTPSY